MYATIRGIIYRIRKKESFFTNNSLIMKSIVRKQKKYSLDLLINFEYINFERMNERSKLIIKLVASHFLLVSGLLCGAMIVGIESFIILSIVQTVLLILFLAGYWEFMGKTFKCFFCCGIEFLIILVIAIKLKTVDFETPSLCWISSFVIAESYLLFLLIRIFIVIFKNDRLAVEIEFPLSNGQYMVTDGGNSKISRLMNYHFHSEAHKRKKTNYSMLYATDIVQVKNSSKKFFPLTNEEYPIFGEKIFCPMEGEVVVLINSIDDNLPYSGNYPYNTGNTVVIQNPYYFILLGHLKKGSIKVKEGESVKIGQLIGLAGNSGYSERPHLHLQLIKSNTGDYWKGDGISMRFKNRNLFKNRLINIR